MRRDLLRIQTVTDAYTQVTLTESTKAGYLRPIRHLYRNDHQQRRRGHRDQNFTDGTTSATAPLNASGVAVLTLSTLSPGTHTFSSQAMRAMEKQLLPLRHRLRLRSSRRRALSLNSNSNPGVTLSPLNLTATITNAEAAPATGNYRVHRGGAAIGTANLDATGHATLTPPGMSATSHAIVASYGGDGANFASASAVYSETIQLRPTTTTVTGSATSSQQFNLVAVVEGQGSASPGGTVTFTSGGATLGQASIGSNGVATLTAATAQSTLLVTARYAGDVNYAASQSAPTPIAAFATAPFSLAASPPSISVATHQHTTITINIGSIQASPIPLRWVTWDSWSSGTCTFTPSQVKLSANGTATASVVVDTGNPLGAGPGTSALLAYSRGTFLCCLPLGLLGPASCGERKGRTLRRTLGMLISCAVAVAVTLGASGCSGLSTNGTPPGSYTFKIVGTGQSSGISETQTITMVVTQ